MIVVTRHSLLCAVQDALGRSERQLDIWLGKHPITKQEFYELWPLSARLVIYDETDLCYLFSISEEERLLLAPHREDPAYLEVWITLRLLRNLKE